MAIHYGQPKKGVYDPGFKKKSGDFSRRKCALCNRSLLPLDKGQTIKLGGKNVLVHKNCRYKYYDKVVPKE